MFRYLAIILVFISISVQSQQKHPKLVIGIVVDQMRDEYIDRFYDDFGSDGFKRLLNNGYRLKNMHYNYFPTYTGPGHASIYTGTTPAYHGIVGNFWYKRDEHKGVYCTSDDRFSAIGVSEKERDGQMSPARNYASTITDELKLSTNFRSKVIGISLKDRGAILPAGHFADMAYWMSGNGNFISSTYYADQLPNWVTKFNDKKYYEKYLNQEWTLLKPESAYDESSADNSLFEGKLAEVLDAKFPYDLKKAYQEAGAEIIKTTPFGNNILADFAKEVIENEDLGKDNITDFLAVSFSSTDYIGHLLGPRSRELQDTYLRLDETIADFLNFLDKKVGKGNYLLFLTADHACAENPNYMNAHKYEMKNLDRKEIIKGLEEFSQNEYGANLVEEFSNQNLYLKTDSIKEQNLDLDKVIKSFQQYLSSLNYVKLTFSESQMLSANDNFLARAYANGYDPKQNGQIVVLYQPGYYEYPDFGTTHGSPYNYDTHVPMLFYGYEIPHKVSYEKHYITEVAPTVAQFLHITMPNSSKGDVINELLEH